MIELEPLTHPGGTVPLGEVCDFAVRARRPDVETRVFLKDGRIFYLEPLSDWARRGAVRLFPDAPGPYTLAVEWRGGGATGWTEARFEVVAGPAEGEVPRQVTVDERTRLWVPSEWEARQMAHHERATMDVLRRVVPPGSVVYDIGAHLGLYAVQLARLVGPAGRVYCLEANPVCVAFLEANLTLNGIDNAEILPVAVTDGRRRSEFTLNYHNCLVGMNAGAVYAGVDVFAGTGAPGGRWRGLLDRARGRAATPGSVTPHRAGTPGSGKAGHRIAMRGRRLDDLIRAYGLRPPDLVKLDIEGGEVLAVRGMRTTLAGRRPVLLVELHGQAAARQTLLALARVGYRYEVTPDGPHFDEPGALLHWFPDACIQVLAHPA